MFGKGTASDHAMLVVYDAWHESCLERSIAAKNKRRAFNEGMEPDPKDLEILEWCVKG
jgi:hypothetical protein